MSTKPSDIRQQLKSLHIHGRRWFERTNGNTYHTVAIFVNGRSIHKTERVYGYGSQYQQSACEWLDANGYLPDIERYKWGGTESLWRYCDRRSIPFVDEVDDVPRRKDL
jgi:hypothetical protein